MKKSKFKTPYFLFIFSSIIGTLLTTYSFFDDVNAFSIYVGYCFFVVIIFFNNKPFKGKKTQQPATNSGDKNMKFLSRFRRNKKGLAGGEIAGFIAAISIGIYLFAYMALPALQALAEANTTGLDAGVATLVTTVVSIIVAVAVIIKFLPSQIKSRIGM